ncbi:SIMPL domain-containing protein [Patescibacteria group bacterium]|nr:SIMPL domain-containing protein [Patescibacteria group bacterium]MBU2220036.1 SIMPL domain-containing protein [Patescibacteria group bacterium]MBU2264874.1 SIMPL domain-containing protein [Patescibacteria group bacterium]
MPEEKDINLKIIPPAKYLPMAAVSVAALLVIFLAAATYNKVVEGRYMGQGLQYKNTISVVGEGKVVAKPDIGQVSLSVVSDAKTVAAAQKDNTEKMNKITQAMKDLGIEEEDLKTTSYNVMPRYQYSAGRSTIIGYEVTQTLDVKIRDLAKVGEILDKAAGAGANQVGSLTFTFDNPESLQSEARQKAITQAKQKAKDLAASLGVNLGKVTSFSENSVGQPSPMYADEAIMGKGGGGGMPEIQTGQNEIEISVYITYEIY